MPKFTGLVVIERPHCFYAGVYINRDVVAKVPHELSYMHGWDYPFLKQFIEDNGWKLTDKLH